MGMLVAFIISLILCFFVVRGAYRKQCASSSGGKFKAVLVSGFLGIATFVVVNTLAAVTLIPEDSNTAATTGAAFDGVTVDKFKQLYNDDLEGIATSGKATSTIRIQSVKQGDNIVEFAINSSVNGLAGVDKDGKISELLWRVSKPSSDSLLSMAVAVEVLDASSDRDTVIAQLEQIVKSDTQKAEFKTKRGEYYVSRDKSGHVSLLITPKY
ncbi:hypothetical protein [Escherichia albertii]|uniref:hypothetical protein n=1 Tax=Escherichia albertii TaxID=208962 RepID=UPI000CF6C6F6|nr:hypothetical protein [Escherichia albertii]EFO1595157.1 hypothetical protein [Escherichia coli]